MKLSTFTAGFCLSVQLLFACSTFAGDFVIGRKDSWQNIVVIPLRTTFPSKDITTLKQELLEVPVTLGVTAFSEVPSRAQSEALIYREGGDSENATRTFLLSVDYNFLDVLHLRIYEGRFFRPEFTSDTTAIVLNESAADILNRDKIENRHNTRVGERIVVKTKSRETSHQIIGIIEDYRYRSTSELIPVPVVFTLSQTDLKYVAVHTSDVKATLKSINDLMFGSAQKGVAEVDVLGNLVTEHDVSARAPQGVRIKATGIGSIAIYTIHIILVSFLVVVLAAFIGKKRWPFVWSIFTFRGRAPRKRFCFVWLPLLLVNIAFLILTEETRYSWISLLYGGLAWTLSVMIQAFNIVQRLHDLNRAGTHYWLLFVPFYNIYLLVVLFFKKGTVGDNRFGSDPIRVRPH